MCNDMGMHSLSLSLSLSLSQLHIDWFIIIPSRSNERKCILCRPGNDPYKLLAYRLILQHLMLYVFVYMFVCVEVLRPSQPNGGQFT